MLRCSLSGHQGNMMGDLLASHLGWCCPGLPSHAQGTPHLGMQSIARWLGSLCTGSIPLLQLVGDRVHLGDRQVSSQVSSIGC